MIVVSFTSGSKGGTGKSTLSSLATLALAGAEVKVLLIDLGQEGNSSRLLLREPEPPFLRDVLQGKVTLLDAIGSYEIKLEKLGSLNFYMIPNLGPLPKPRELEAFFRELKELENCIDIVFLDLPAYQDPWFNKFIDYSDLVVLVANPFPYVVNAVINAYTDGKEVIAVLNKFVKGCECYLNLLGERYKRTIAIAYDPYVALLDSANLTKILEKLSKKFQDGLVELCFQIAKVGGLCG